MKTTFVFVVASPLLCLVIAGSPAAAAPKVREFKPVTPWNVHYEDESCKLRRDFTDSGDNRVGLEFTSLAIGDAFHFALIGHPVRSLSEATKVTVEFGPLPEQVVANTNGGADGGKISGDAAVPAGAQTRRSRIGQARV